VIHALLANWDSVYPNIEASALLAPVGWLYHRHVKRMHEAHQAEMRRIVQGKEGSDGGQGS
jgi:hypothetical protein